MDLRDWDQEAQIIGTQLDSTYELYLSTHSIQKRVLLNIKNSILNLQGHLSITLEKLTHASKRKSMLPSRQRSLVHWGGVYAEYAQSYYTQKVGTLGKNLWLQLLRLRMPGMNYDHSLPFSDEHLVEVSLRYRQLKEIELQLHSDVHALKAQQEDMRHQYNDMKTISANQDSANSLNLRFGNNPTESLRHPVLGRVKSALKKVLGATHVEKQYPYLAEQRKTANILSKRVLDDCKTLVLQDLEAPSSTPNAATITHYRESLAKIHDLELQLMEANRLLNQNPPPIHPILVKKS